MLIKLIKPIFQSFIHKTDRKTYANMIGRSWTTGIRDCIYTSSPLPPQRTSDHNLRYCSNILEYLQGTEREERVRDEEYRTSRRAKLTTARRFTNKQTRPPTATRQRCDQNQTRSVESVAAFYPHARRRGTRRLTSRGED